VDLSHVLATLLILVVGGTVAVTALGWIVMGIAALFGWRGEK
jgi:hypothetical protein